MKAGRLYVCVFLAVTFAGCTTYDLSAVRDRIESQPTVQVIFPTYDIQTHLIQIDRQLAQATDLIDQRYLVAYEVFLETFGEAFGVELVPVEWSLDGLSLKYTEPLDEGGAQILVSISPNFASAFAGQPDQLELLFSIGVQTGADFTVLWPNRAVSRTVGPWSDYLTDPTFLLDEFLEDVRAGTRDFVAELRSAAPP